jgi:hypothetical protein
MKLTRVASGRKLDDLAGQKRAAAASAVAPVQHGAAVEVAGRVYEGDAVGQRVGATLGVERGPGLAIGTDILAFVLADRAGGWRRCARRVVGAAGGADVGSHGAWWARLSSGACSRSSSP